jgi:hypothetical protein
MRGRLCEQSASRIALRSIRATLLSEGEGRYPAVFGRASSRSRERAGMRRASSSFASGESSRATRLSSRKQTQPRTQIVVANNANSARTVLMPRRRFIRLQQEARLEGRRRQSAAVRLSHSTFGGCDCGGEGAAAALPSLVGGELSNFPQSVGTRFGPISQMQPPAKIGRRAGKYALSKRHIVWNSSG